MTLYKSWCTGTQKKTKKKTLRAYSETKSGRAKVLSQLGANRTMPDLIADAAGCRPAQDGSIRGSTTAKCTSAATRSNDCSVG